LWAGDLGAGFHGSVEWAGDLGAGFHGSKDWFAGFDGVPPA
jgi:hypothetical protein